MKSKPNVLLLIASFDLGGAESQILLLARLLRDSGRYHVHLASLRREGILLEEAEQLGFTDIPEFPLTSFYDSNAAIQLHRLRKFLRERQIDIIHTEGFYTNVFGIVGAALAQVPARVAFRGETGGWRTTMQNRVERQAFRLASVIHANSQAVKQYLVDLGVPEKRIAVIYNGLDMARVAPTLESKDARASFGLPTGDNYQFVTIVANLHNEVKDHPMFLRAAKLVSEEMPDALFLIAGEGQLTDSMRNLAFNLGLEKKVFFIGRCSRLADLLVSSDVCVLSSTAEGFSNAILEYMGAGRPVVATDVGGAREAIVEGESGYLVPSGDHELMATRLISLLLQPDRARAMGLYGKEIVREKFSIEAQLKRTEDLYDSLLAKKGRRLSVPVRVSRGADV